jgi:EAL domain-containing protein (putative c-di-GMP-specific phosphodiesterase class I)
VGTHLSVPIRNQNGRLFGTLCCFSHSVRDDVKESDLALLRPLAEFVGALLEHEENENAESAEVRARIEHVLRTGGPTMVFQPIVDIDSRVPAGYEALARFRDQRTPDTWFAEAWGVGLGSDLEVMAVANALREFTASGLDGYVSVNLSPGALEFVETIDSLSVLASDRLVIEITEHAAIRDPRMLLNRLADFRAAGGKLAIDDMGTGYSGLTHLIELSPDIVKLDRSLVTGIAHGNARHSLARFLVAFCAEVGATIIAEGVETEEESATLHAIGVRLAQGYLFARPGPLTGIAGTGA